jgi:hypothetical protein
MRSIAVIVAFGLLASIAIGGLSGTYTIKPGGGGDFLSLDAAGQALDSAGMSGDCVFEIYGDTLYGTFLADGVAGSDSWTTTFRPGSGASPVILSDEFACAGYDNVKIESVRILTTYITTSGCSGWRISGCRFTTNDWGVKLESSSYDTVDANTFDIYPKYGGHYPCIMVEGGSDNFIFNNIMNPDTCGVEALVDLDMARNTRFVFNTLRVPPWEMAIASGIEIRYNVPCEVRNNVFVLARPADTVNACVSVPNAAADSIELDHNCYFVESLGYVGARPFYPGNLYGWNAWRGFGFEANGINADPMFVSATDLHLRQGSPCNTRATPIAGVNSDIDGDPRDPTHPDMGADEIAGSAVEETPSAEVQARNVATVVSGVLFLPEASSHKPQATRLLDISGRKVLDLRSGANDVRALAPGVYFFRRASSVERDASSVAKVVVTR